MTLRVLLLVCSLALGACVTTSTGSSRMTGDKAEAARLNMELGIGYFRQSRFQDARERLERSIRDEPVNPTAQRVLAMVYEELDENSLAEKHYRLAVRQGPNDADALNSFAVFLCRTQTGTTEALRLFDRAVVVPLYPNRFLINTNAGTCAARSDLQLAEDYLRRALEQNPRFPEALFQMASVAYKRSNYLQGRAFVQRYLAVSPPLPEVLWLGYTLESALGDREAAASYSGQLLEQFPASIEARKLLEQQRASG